MLTAKQREFYAENGYLLVEGLLSRDEAQTYRQAGHDLIGRLEAQQEVDATWGSARDEGAAMTGASMTGAGMTGATMTKTRLLHCHDVQYQDALFSRLLVDERLTEAASELMGTPNVELHHNKMFIKPPERGSPFPMHQDHPFFPHDRHSMIAAVFHFDDAPLEKGCIRVVPGSHKLGPLPHDPEGSFHLPTSEYPLESSTPCPAKAGDVLFFSYLTIHGSGVNTSSEARTTWLVQLRDPSDPPSNDEHRSRGQGTILRGIDPAGKR